MNSQPHIMGTLGPGYFRLRLVKGGPQVGAEIFYGPPLDPVTGEPLERSHRWMVRINGKVHKDCLLDERDPGGAMVWRVSHSHRISRDDYEHMARVAEWARKNAPGLPEARPADRIKLGEMKSLF